MAKVEAHRLETIGEYVFARLNKIAKEVKQTSGKPILDLGAGSPDIPPSPMYLQKYAEFIAGNDAHLYPGYGAIPEFSKALIEWYKKRFGVELSTDELLPLNGAKDGIVHLPLALFNEGDEVLIPNPGYPAFREPAMLVGAKVIPYNLSRDFRLDLAEIAKKVTKRTRAIWVNFPSNPTNQVVTVDELKLLVDFAVRHQILVLYDNAYSEITFDGYVAPSILQVPGAIDVSIEINSFSKAFSFAGYRMGWAVGNSSLVSALAKVKSQLDSGMSLPLQRLGAYALHNDDRAWRSKALSEYQRRRSLIAGQLGRLGFSFELPQGGLYIWAKLPEGYNNSEEFCLELLRNCQILMTPGDVYGNNGKGYVRVCVCSNVDGIERYFDQAVNWTMHKIR